MSFISEARIQHLIDRKTKPTGALGKLESLALQIALWQQSPTPSLSAPTILVFAGDHGIAREGVSAYPQEVTWQMVMNFVQGGAAINVFCRQHQLSLQIIDAGVNYDFPPLLPVVHEKMGPGTANFLYKPAMTEADLTKAIDAGRRQVAVLAKKGCTLLGLGEMGIGNTSAASLLMHKLTGLPLQDCTGRGTGLDASRYQHKLHVLTRAAARTDSTLSARQAMQEYGGFEMAMMLGAMLEAADRRILLLVDGFIATVVYAAAMQLCPGLEKGAICCHQGSEKGHTLLLQWLKAAPLLHLGLRLGEGTGCALAYPLIQSAIAFLNEMASFDGAGVSDKPDTSTEG